MASSKVTFTFTVYCLIRVESAQRITTVRSNNTLLPTTQVTRLQTVLTPKTTICTSHCCNPSTSHEIFDIYQLATNRIKSENGERDPTPRYSTGGSVTHHGPCADVPCGGGEKGSSAWVQLLHLCSISNTSVCSVPQVKDLQPTVWYNCFEAHLPFVSILWLTQKSKSKSSVGRLAVNEWIIRRE